MVRPPRRTRAASYSGQFVTRYLALGNLWRRLALNLYGMGFQNYDDGTTGPVYRPGADAAIRPSIPRPPSTGRDPCTRLSADRSPGPPRKPCVLFIP